MKKVNSKSSDTRLWAMAGASTMVLGVVGIGFAPSMAFAQDAQEEITSPASEDGAVDLDDEDDDGDTIVITGQRQALETAADLKRESDTIGDSLVLDEAGKVPSTSLLEILERAPGVTMNRIRAGSEGSPDGFAFEGSGVQVRGLNKTKTLINGREVFSANGGSGLSWADVGPELLKTVTVYKASRADLIEGGVSGTVNLVTAMPFDHDGFKGSAAITADYGDFSEEVTPAGSIMLSNRWDTGIGEIGVLVDVAYSKIASHDSNIIIPPFYATEYEGERVYVPGGVRYTQDQFERTRNGYYGAVQWRPTDNLEFFHTTFISERESNRESQIMGPEPGAPWGVFPGAVFDENNVLVSGSIGSTNLTSGQAVAMNSSFTPGFSKTSDYSTGFKYDGDGWDLSGSYQYVDAESRSGKYSIGLAVIPQIIETEVDFTGDIPYFNFVQDLSTDPADAGASRINWLDMSNEGNAHAFQLDASFDIGDGFFKKVAIGGRVADREESDSFVGTWWSPTGRNWNGVPRAFVDTAPEGDFYLEDFGDFFKGDVEPLGSVWIPTRQINSSDQFDRVYDTYTACGPDLYYQCSNPDTTTYLYGSDPRNRNFDQLPAMYTTEADTQSAYAMVGFANEGAGWMNFSGNLGVRWVNYDVSSMGNFNFNGGATFFESEADQQAFIDSIGGIENLVDWEEANPNTPYPGSLETIGFSDDIAGSYEEDYFLPSFNIKFEPQDGWIARYALTQTLTPPRYPDIRAQGIASAQSVDSTLNDEIREYWLANGADEDEQSTSIPGVFNGYTNTSGNPTLEPEVSLNHDVSLEWYPRRGSTVYLSLFHKTIDNYITFDNASFAASALFADGTQPQTAPLIVNPDDPDQPPVVDPSQSFFLDGPVTSRQNTNADSDTIIRGFELGGRTYFDNLPGAWSGFGVTGNVTYIDNDAPDAFARDINGDVLNVPVVGLSKWAYSATLLYDYEKVSARLAYNWRDRYLATTNDSGTTNTYTDYTGEVIQFGLPVYSAEQERLDGSVSYKLTDRMNIKFNVQNILDQEQRTETELLDGVFTDRAVFVTDRRYSLHLGFDF